MNCLSYIWNELNSQNTYSAEYMKLNKKRRCYNNKTKKLKDSFTKCNRNNLFGSNATLVGMDATIFYKPMLLLKITKYKQNKTSQNTILICVQSISTKKLSYIFGTF